MWEEKSSGKLGWWRGRNEYFGLYPWADKCLEKLVSWSLTMVCKKEAQGPSDTSGITVKDGVS